MAVRGFFSSVVLYLNGTKKWYAMGLVEMQVDQIPYAHATCKILSSSFMALCILNQTEGQCEGE